MPISSRQLNALEARRLRDALGQTLRDHLSAGEHVREWVFGRTWPSEAARLGRGMLMSRGALGGALYGYIMGRSQPRYIVLTNRRVLSLVGDSGGVSLEWGDDAPAVAADLRRVALGSELVVRRRGGETRLHVDSPFRKQAKALLAAL